ncbi:hypothetical protein L1887_17128 [Cichorium endivia]|nr:hypothetical protein L1887_17128 [Cichorium endivia]
MPTASLAPVAARHHVRGSLFVVPSIYSRALSGNLYEQAIQALAPDDLGGRSRECSIRELAWRVRIYTHQGASLEATPDAIKGMVRYELRSMNASVLEIMQVVRRLDMSGVGNKIAFADLADVARYLWMRRQFQTCQDRDVDVVHQEYPSHTMRMRRATMRQERARVHARLDRVYASLDAILA